MFEHFDPAPLPAPRPLARLLDVTLRDGGFEVDFAWPEDLFADLTATLPPLGVDVVELGYIGGVPLEHAVSAAGRGANLTPRMVGAACTPGVRLAAMVHPTALGNWSRLESDGDELTLAAFASAGLDMIRLVYHQDWFEPLARIASRAREERLAVSVNIALASRFREGELRFHIARIVETIAPDILYLADTCGALEPRQVSDLIGEVVTELDGDPRIQVGFHAHDFLTLAYANSLAAVEAGATWLDCSLLGLGRGGSTGAGAGGGNLSTELMLLRHRLPERALPTGLANLMRLRTRLAGEAAREPASLVAMACGALNLTPVEEQALRAFAAEADLDPSLVALWLASRYRDVNSLKPAGLQMAWAQGEAP